MRLSNTKVLTSYDSRTGNNRSKHLRRALSSLWTDDSAFSEGANQIRNAVVCPGLCYGDKNLIVDKGVFMAGNGNTAFRFRVALRLDGRECWREILVPASLTFFDLHAVLQECFMWYGEHLFCFCATFPDGKQVQVEELWGEESAYHEAKYEQYMPVEPLPEVRIASETELGDVFPKARTARYYYDYGDDWIHDIKLLRTYRSVHVADPQLWDGAGDAPPEDVGGVYGFERFLDTLGNPEDEEHDGMVEWAKDQMWDRLTLNRHRERLFRWHKHRDMMLQ